MTQQEWRIGDYFLIQIENQFFSLGQILGYEPSAMDSVICAFWGSRINPDQRHEFMAREDGLIAVLFVTRDLLDKGVWKVVKQGKPIRARKYLPLFTLRLRGFVGAKIYGSANVVKFLNAYFGLYPWNSFADPLYLDQMLLSPDKKPKEIVIK